MAGEEATAVADDTSFTITAIQSLIRLVQGVVRIFAAGFGGPFKKDCADLSRRIALLSHLLEEFRDFKGDLRPLDEFASSSSSSSSCPISRWLFKVQKHCFCRRQFEPKISSICFSLCAALDLYCMCLISVLSLSVRSSLSVCISYEDKKAFENKGIERKIVDKMYQTYSFELTGKRFAYDGEKSLYTVGPLPQNKLEFTVVLEESFAKQTFVHIISV